MIRFGRFLFIIVFNVLFATQAFALKADFESVRKFHNAEVEQLLKDYTLEDSLTIRMELKRKDLELKDQKVVDIPGLYQKTGEVDDRGLENILNLYERRVVIIKKREVSEKEIDLVKQALMERLFLPKETTFTELDNIPTLDSAVKNLKSDFLFGAYETLIKGGQFLWIIIFSIGFIAAMWFLARVWKAKTVAGDGGGGSGSGSGGSGGAGGGESHGNSENNIQAEEFGFDKDLNVATKNSKAFETLNFESLCRNLNDCYDHLPGSTSHTMWQNFPDLNTQIQFIEIIRIQDQVKDELRNKTYEVLEKIFDFKNRAAITYIKKKSKGITKEGLANLSIDLARQKFIAPNEALEKCYQAVYPSKGDNIELLLEKSYDEHYVVLYKMFKDYFMSYLSVLNDDSIMYKINSLLTFEPCGDHAPDAKYKAFYDYASKLSFNTGNETKKSTINPKMISMIYSMPETELVKIDAMKTNEELRSQIPNFDWIQLEDAKLLKEFFSNLSGPEIKYLIEFDPKFNEAMNKLDERALFRFNERMKKEAHMALDWRSFRDKIKKCYKYKSAGSDVQTNIAKAS